MGAAVYSVNHKYEFMVSNMLSASGNTHGWHLDDPRLALVIFLSVPEDPFKWQSGIHQALAGIVRR